MGNSKYLDTLNADEKRHCMKSFGKYKIINVSFVAMKLI